MQTETYNPRYTFASPTRKPVIGTTIRPYPSRPNSSLRNKTENDSNSSSPSPNDSRIKKPSIGRYPLASPGLTNQPASPSKPFEARPHVYRRKNDDNLSNSGLGKTVKLERNLNIETSGAPNSFSGINLKGYSVTNTNSNSLAYARKIASIAGPMSSSKLNYSTSPTSTSFGYGNGVSGTGRGNTPPPNKANQSGLVRKYGNNKTYTNPNLSTSGLPNNSGSNFYNFNTPPNEERKGYNKSFTTTVEKVDKMTEEEMAYLPIFEPTKCSIKPNGVIKAYGVNTHQGLVRNYNEDRVAIILNIMKPPHLGPEDEWPACSFFGVYDGHGGAMCADFLRDSLHQYVIQDGNFPRNPAEALRRGFAEAERAFTEIALQQRPDIDRSGSCAIVTLIVGRTNLL